jgi:hypothetical protein
VILIGITGRARHGKDTVASFLVRERGFHRYAFADQLRELALRVNPLVDFGGEDEYDYSTMRLREYVHQVGWETAKSNGEVRRLLQQLGAGARDIFGPDVWVQALERYWKEEPGRTPDRLVISDVRYPNETRWIRNQGGEVWRVVRPDFDNGVDPSHESERFVPSLPVSREVRASSVEELELFAAKAPLL